MYILWVTISTLIVDIDLIVQLFPKLSPRSRLTSLNEVHRRHESDLDKVVDDLIGSQSEIETLESRIPDLAERHRFFQDLRGYVTDLVECFNEKVSKSN